MQKRPRNVRINSSIYLGELEKGKFYLFSYFEYIGDDFGADMEKMASEATTFPSGDIELAINRVKSHESRYVKCVLDALG